MRCSIKSVSKTSGFFLILMTSLLITQAQTTGTGSGIPSSRPTGEACIHMSFEATAYYSPLSNQRFFWNGSYADETKMNGNGVAGASGKPVFNGMIAAPKHLNFGTQIIIPERGNGVVEDRGGAIVGSGGSGTKMRIDLWMGKGEIGLLRSISFGRRNLTGLICSGTQQSITQQSIGFKPENIPIAPDFFRQTLRAQTLSPGRSDPRVHVLQTHLEKIEYLEKPFIQGTFDEATKQAVCNFQIEYGIIGDKQDPLCGIFGQQTRVQLRQLIKEKTTGATKQEIKKQESVATKPIQKKGTLVILSRAYQRGENHSEIGKLQEFLKEQGLYGYPTTAVLDSNTLEAIYQFQLAYKILTPDSPVGIRGHLGPLTQKTLKEISQQKAQ